MSYENRIKSYKVVTASELIDNPLNWRKHPAKQKNSMKAILEDVGYADAIKVVETPAGLMIIDGHLRKEISSKDQVPVLVLDLTPEEQEIMLATFDPISGMAETDTQLLKDLIEGIDSDSQGINDLLADIESDRSLTFPEPNPKEYDESVADDVELIICPKCGHEFAE